MQGHVHQALVLTVFGNEYLHGRDVGRPWPDSPAFRYSKQTTFVDGTPADKTNAPVAADPLDWFAWLKANGIRRLWMGHQAENREVEDYNTVVFGGGGRWMIETQKDAASDIWRSRSQVVDKGAADKKIWSDTYYRFAKDWHKINSGAPDLARVRTDLASILPKVLAFARQDALKASFAEYFEKGEKKLADPDPLAGGFLEEFNRTSLSLDARQILGAASASWVFGGMSWWNDGVPQTDSKTYLALTEQLWQALTTAIVSVANSLA